MRRIILASHGALAEGMADTIAMIIGEQPQLSALSLRPGGHPDLLRNQIEQEMAIHPEDEWIILTDLWGGSVNNSLLTLCLKPHVHVIAGMNLCLALQLCLLGEGELSELLEQAVQEGRQGLIYGNAALHTKQQDEELF